MPSSELAGCGITSGSFVALRRMAEASPSAVTSPALLGIHGKNADHIDGAFRR